MNDPDDKNRHKAFAPVGEADPAQFACAETDYRLLNVRREESSGPSSTVCANRWHPRSNHMAEGRFRKADCRNGVDTAAPMVQPSDGRGDDAPRMETVMIVRVATVTVLVMDQDRALAFYVDKLGFEKRDDVPGADYRWLVVAPRGAETQVYLAKAGPGTLHANEPVGGQTGVMFECADVRATHAELAALGVQFPQPPATLPYGIQAQLQDPDGNIFLLQQSPP